MREQLKTIIRDFHNEALQTGIRRRLDYEIVKRKAFICIGVRRCGKSTLLFQAIDTLEQMNQGVSPLDFLNYLKSSWLTPCKK